MPKTRYHFPATVTHVAKQTRVNRVAKDGTQEVEFLGWGLRLGFDGSTEFTFLLPEEPLAPVGSTITLLLEVPTKTEPL